MYSRRKMSATGKSIVFFVGSILSACVAVLLFILNLDYPNSLLLPWFCVLFMSIAFGMGILAVTEIFTNKIICFLELVILLFVAFYLLGFSLGEHSFYRMRRSVSFNLNGHLIQIKNSFDEYFKNNDSLPNANNWCYTLMESDSEIDESDFSIGQLPKIECVFAFNKNISHISFDKLQGNVVLLFEAEGYLNLSGGPELIAKERTKDICFSLHRRIFIYVLFLDGTIVKYRLSDGAVAIYKPTEDGKHSYFDKNIFTDWLKKGETPYSPLRWK